ncbi:succinylglutamate desuccinylase/aspartoacylase family protein [Patescibacteria group bacterium]|nr:succinylglutamate desuccinylase/aspartoacylase family protein [Patescibacteria group bacterium]MBU1907412.1 succinylglutamate desuccinylase/aspartoacylase family protein [Patescibacteria group bacterium]
MKNKTLFIGGTHGNEPIGVEACERLAATRQDFDWIIGNPLALEIGEREFEGDLNRSAPGSSRADNYASRRATNILDISRNYRYTIDLHGTDKNTGLFIIICNPKAENLQLASMLDIKRIVLWPSFSPELAGPLSEYFPCGLEIECGPKNDPTTRIELERVLNYFLNNVNKREDVCDLIGREVFEVYGALRQPVDVDLKEFTRVEIDGEQFYPLLVGSYQNSGVICYKMRRIDPLNPDSTKEKSNDSDPNL